MGISWSYRQSGQEEEFLFNFLSRSPGNRQSGGSGHQNGETRERSRGRFSAGYWRQLLRMSNSDHAAEPNRPSAESDDYDDREDESIAAILSSLIRSGQIRLISPEGSYTDDVVMEAAGGASDSSEEQRGNEGAGSRAPSRLKSTDLKTIVELNSGQYSICKRTMAGRRSIVSRLRDRELGGAMRQSGAPISSYLTEGDKCYISNHMLPNVMSKIDTYRSKVFCGQYTKDGRVLITACQDQRIRFYDMTKLSDSGCTRIRPAVPSANGSLTPSSSLQFHSVEAKDVGWSILDVAISPDGRHAVYSSWSDYIHQCNIYETGDENHAAFHLHPGEYRFCVFSLRFSADGNEILAGASDRCLYVYDRQRNTRTLKISAHEDDVNAVCFADDASHIVYSGGDDGLCKVWDRRTLSEEHPKPVGVLAGHADGITFIDSKGDARYLISNSKDQSIKLWDIRKFSTDDAMNATRAAVAKQGWDYRWQNVPRKALKYQQLDGDTSVMTYRDHHTVLHTLIRCFFSPAFNTGQRYVYTGCASGACVVYDLLTGALVKRMKGHHACVRDVSWHPHRNEICTASWDAVVARWTFDGRTESDCEDDSSQSLTEDSSDAEDIGVSATQTAAGRLWRLYRRRQAPLRRSERIRERRRRGMPSMRFD